MWRITSEWPVIRPAKACKSYGASSFLSRSSGVISFSRLATLTSQVSGNRFEPDLPKVRSVRYIPRIIK
jgi:hypothetical protein